MTGSVSGEHVVCELEFMSSYSPLNVLTTLVTYVLDTIEKEPVDPARIKSAAEAVALKWRLWAGRAQVESPGPVAKRSILVPTGDISPDYPLVHFTSSKKDGLCPTKIPALAADKCVAVPGIDPALSSAPGQAFAFDAIAKANQPLISIVVSTFSSCQTIAFGFNHLIADAKGMAMYFRAFSAELNGREWTAPPLDNSSRMDAAFNVVQQKIEDVPEASKEMCVQKNGYSHGLMPLTFLTLLKVIPAIMWDKLRHGSEDAALFIGEDIAAWLINKTKAEVSARGEKEFVTSFDVLVAWWMKAAYADDPQHGQVTLSGTMCLRDMLSQASGVDLNSPELGLCSIWIYNQPWPCPHTTSLADLALFHRRLLLKQRTLSQIASANSLIRSSHASGSRCPLFFGVGKDAYIVSNQSRTGMCTSLDWGRGEGEGKGQYVAVHLREGNDRITLLNKLEHGWTWQSTTRPARWATIRRELIKLQREWESAKGKD